MKTAFDHLRQTRKNLLSLLEKHEEKAFTNPEGFNNNLFWNFAHCVVTQQLLCYKLSGNKMILEDEIVDKYRKGTKSNNEMPSPIEIGIIKDLAITAVDQLEKDYNEGLFNSFNDYPTSFGITLSSIEDAIQFNNLHEGLHFGYMLAMAR